MTRANNPAAHIRQRLDRWAREMEFTAAHIQLAGIAATCALILETLKHKAPLDAGEPERMD